jgi:hypothetical protein
VARQKIFEGAGTPLPFCFFDRFLSAEQKYLECQIVALQICYGAIRNTVSGSNQI